MQRLRNRPQLPYSRSTHEDLPNWWRWDEELVVLKEPHIEHFWKSFQLVRDLLHKKRDFQWKLRMQIALNLCRTKRMKLDKPLESLWNLCKLIRQQNHEGNEHDMDQLQLHERRVVRVHFHRLLASLLQLLQLPDCLNWKWLLGRGECRSCCVQSLMRNKRGVRGCRCHEEERQRWGRDGKCQRQSQERGEFDFRDLRKII